MSDPTFPGTRADPPDRMTGMGGTTAGNDLRNAREDLREGAEALRGGAADAAETLRREAAAAGRTLKQEGTQVLHDVQERAVEAAERGKHAGAEQAEGIARAVHRAASELEDNSPQLASIVHDAAGTIDRMARSLQESSPGDMLQGVQDFARRQPLAFFGATVLAGFAIARFARASAPRSAGTGSTYGMTGEDMSAGMDPYGSSAASRGGMARADHAGEGHGSTGGLGVADPYRGAAGTGGANPYTSIDPTGGASAGMDPTGTGGGMASPGGAAQAPGWVAGEDGKPRPSTLASASLGGAAAMRGSDQARTAAEPSTGGDRRDSV